MYQKGYTTVKKYDKHLTKVIDTVYSLFYSETCLILKQDLLMGASLILSSIFPAV